MYIAILGRQAALGMAELERLYGRDSVDWFSSTAAIIKTDTPVDISRLGGSLKVAHITQTGKGNWRDASYAASKKFSSEWIGHEGKITLGISAYGFDTSPREVQKIGLVIKQTLKKNGVSLRLVPNTEAALSTATSHHNKLGLSDNKKELLIIRGKNGTFCLAESTGAQNITAYTKRDQERPKRDAFVGMLPPKLAQIIINLAAPAPGSRVLDPFCGTGVVLQEALLAGFSAYGTDLADKMIDFSRQNIEWLAQKHRFSGTIDLHQGDAMAARWQPPIDAVACESYLGQPFSAPPSPQKLLQVRDNCDHIISSFLKNISSQLAAGTPLCIAVPAWRDANGGFTHLPLIRRLEAFGFKLVHLRNVSQTDLLYYREDQIVARELLVLVKK